jgi:hypothetical protein
VVSDKAAVEAVEALQAKEAVTGSNQGVRAKTVEEMVESFFKGSTSEVGAGGDY